MARDGEVGRDPLLDLVAIIQTYIHGQLEALKDVVLGAESAQKRN